MYRFRAQGILGTSFFCFIYQECLNENATKQCANKFITRQLKIHDLWFLLKLGNSLFSNKHDSNKKIYCRTKKFK